MKCSVCNVEVTSSGGTFCPQCGAKLPAGAPVEPAKPTDVAAIKGEGSGVYPRPRGVTDVPEETLWEGSYSPKAMLGPTAIAGVVSLAAIVLAIIVGGSWTWVILAVIPLVWGYLAVKLAIARLGISYKLTNQMFYHKRGVLKRVTDRIELIEIHDVTYEQGLIERFVNVGTVKISSNDRTHPRLPLPGIENVEEVAKSIDKARRGEQIRRGRRIESIGVQS